MVESTRWAARTSALFLGPILCLADCPAQSKTAPGESPQGPPKPPAQQQLNGRTFCDKVIGVIGDQVILLSSIEEELRVLEELDPRPWNQARREEETWRLLRDIARKEIWVQYGKVIGGESPEQFKQATDRIVAERMAEEEQRYGSFTRMTEELGNIGVSRSSVESQVRSQLLSDIGQWSAMGQLSQRSNLMVTPKAMRRFFDENPELFAIQGEVLFARMWFRADMDGVEECMANAALAWGDPEAEPDEIAARFGGRFRGMDSVQAGPEDQHAEAIREFALNAEEGAISKPILLGGTYRLLKVLDKTLAENKPFEDAEVQEYCRQRLQERQMAETKMNVIERNSAKLLIWPPRLRRELMGR